MPDAQLPPSDDVRTPVDYGNLTYSNPYGQVVHPRWAGGEVVWSIPCGPVEVDLKKADVADEYIVVYSVDADGENAEKVPGQYTIYDTKPGDPGYSPLWRHNYVQVPRDYKPQTLRSKEDVMSAASGLSRPMSSPIDPCSRAGVSSPRTKAARSIPRSADVAPPRFR